KVPRIAASFPRCIARVILFLKKFFALVSLVTRSNFEPTQFTNFLAIGAYTPMVSIATGMNKKCGSRNWYFRSFSRSNSSAAAPGNLDVFMTRQGARVSPHVKSQTKDFPRLHGTMVIPSGLFPSSLEQPAGSRMFGTSAVRRARLIMSFTASCRDLRPADLIHLRPCQPFDDTSLPHGHLWGWQTSPPSRRAQITRNDSSSSSVPSGGDGRALSQLLVSGC